MFIQILLLLQVTFFQKSEIALEATLFGKQQRQSTEQGPSTPLAVFTLCLLSWTACTGFFYCRRNQLACEEA